VVAIIVVTSAALLGLTILQVYLLQNAVEKERHAFRQNVNAVLSNVIQQLEKREAVTAVFQTVRETHRDSAKEHIFLDVDEQRERGNLKRIKLRRSNQWIPDLRLDSTKVIFFLPSRQHVKLRLLDSAGTAVKELVNARMPSGKNEVKLESELVRQGTFGISLIADSVSYIARFSQGEEEQMVLPAGDNERRLIVSRVLNELSGRKALAVEERIQPSVLDSLLSSGLADAGIETPVAYGIISAESDSVFLANQAGYKDELRTSAFRAQLFPGDIFSTSRSLAVYFPQQDLYLLGRVALPVAIAILFIAILVFSFIYIVRLFFNQRAFSQRLTSFINNMTHEFKTPLSTIALASETLANAKSESDENRQRRYSNIIRDENRRMQAQVEKILQMALLEEGDLELNLNRVDLHELLNQAVQKFMLQVEKRKGRIQTEFAADRSAVRADAVHLTNIFASLLDNALKYTRRAPEIMITTENVDGTLRIKVTDNGIGLRPEERSRIFEKYYRVPTGNLHDVKGFGLGLSYVQLMVDAHGGEIDVASQVNYGTTFTLTFPVVK